MVSQHQACHDTTATCNSNGTVLQPKVDRRTVPHDTRGKCQSRVRPRATPPCYPPGWPSSGLPALTSWSCTPCRSQRACHISTSAPAQHVSTGVPARHPSMGHPMHKPAPRISHQHHSV